MLVRVVCSIQNSYIKYSTQNFYYFIVSIYLRFHLFGNYSVMEFSRAEYSADHSALFRRNIRNLRYRSSGWYA
jgi:hypothetical protein